MHALSEHANLAPVFCGNLKRSQTWMCNAMQKYKISFLTAVFNVAVKDVNHLTTFSDLLHDNRE